MTMVSVLTAGDICLCVCLYRAVFPRGVFVIRRSLTVCTDKVLSFRRPFSVSSVHFLLRCREKFNAGFSCHLVSAVRVISTSLRGVIHEGDIRAFDSWRGIFVVPERTCGAADPPGGGGFGRPATGRDAGGNAGEERNAARGGVGTAADENILPPWSCLSPTLSFEALLEGLRFEVVGDEEAGCAGTGDGGEEGGRDGLVPEAVGGLGGQEIGASNEEGDSGSLSRPHEPAGLPVGDRGRDDDAHAQRQKGCLQRRKTDTPSVVAEVKGLRVGVDSAGVAGDDDRAVGTRRVSLVRGRGVNYSNLWVVAFSGVRGALRFSLCTGIHAKMPVNRRQNRRDEHKHKGKHCVCVFFLAGSCGILQYAELLVDLDERSAFWRVRKSPLVVAASAPPDDEGHVVFYWSTRENIPREALSGRPPAPFH